MHSVPLMEEGVPLGVVRLPGALPRVRYSPPLVGSVPKRRHGNQYGVPHEGMKSPRYSTRIAHAPSCRPIPAGAIPALDVPGINRARVVRY